MNIQQKKYTQQAHERNMRLYSFRDEVTHDAMDVEAICRSALDFNDALIENLESDQLIIERLKGVK
jgi:hypothetical protein